MELTIDATVYKGKEVTGFELYFKKRAFDLINSEEIVFSESKDEEGTFIIKRPTLDTLKTYKIAGKKVWFSSYTDWVDLVGDYTLDPIDEDEIHLVKIKKEQK